MNILLINHYAGSPEMGMEFRPYYFAREWVKMGHKVSIIAADYSHLRRVNPEVSKDFQKENIEGIDYYWIKTNRYDGNGVKRSMTMAKFVSKIWMKAKWIVDTMKPDVVICSSTYPLDTYVGQRIKKVSKKKVKLIHEVHDMWPATLIEMGGMSKKHPFVVAMQIGENSAYKNSDLVVSLLPNAEPYMKEHGLKDGCFKCIPNGVVLEEWENPIKLYDEYKEIFDKLHEEKKFIVGYFGGHALSNALDTLLDVADNMKGENVHFVLVGNGVEKSNLISRAEKMELTNVTFLNAIPKAMVPSLCKEFDCNYMGGHKTTLYRFGLCLNKMFDCMASGKPSICAMGVSSYFSEYNCGYDIEATNIKEIAKNILNVKRMDESELDALKQSAYKASRERFNYEKLAKEFIDIM